MLTQQQRAALLVSAKILDENGYYHKDFFSKETVEKSKTRNANCGNNLNRTNKEFKMSINENAKDFFHSKFKSKFNGCFLTEVIDITPDDAKKMLSFSNGNRPLKSNHINNLCNQIENNTFVITNNAIAFNKDLILCDGHHRLEAIRKSGKSVKCFVAIGMESDNFKFVDIGVKRSNADIIKMYSNQDFEFEINGSIVAISSSMIKAFYKNGNHISGDMQTILDCISTNKDGFYFCVKNLKNNTRNVTTAAVKAGIVSAYPHVNKEKLEIFCSHLNIGATSSMQAKSNAGLVCRDFLITKINDHFRKLSLTGHSGMQSIKVIIGSVQYCIQKFMNDENIKTVYSGASLNKDDNKIIFKPFLYLPKM